MDGTLFYIRADRGVLRLRGAPACSLAASIFFNTALIGGFLAQLGFLGLGIMGYPMALHLVESGNEVALWSNTAKKAQELARITASTRFLRQ